MRDLIAKEPSLCNQNNRPFAIAKSPSEMAYCGHASEGEA